MMVIRRRSCTASLFGIGMAMISATFQGSGKYFIRNAELKIFLNCLDLQMFFLNGQRGLFPFLLECSPKNFSLALEEVGAWLLCRIFRMSALEYSL